jgi:hypothetical protein
VYGHRAAVVEGEAAVAGDVVGMVVGLEDALDPHPVALGLIHEGLDRVHRVDKDSDPRLLVADEVRGAPEVIIEELTKDHVVIIN